MKGIIPAYEIKVTIPYDSESTGFMLKRSSPYRTLLVTKSTPLDQFAFAIINAFEFEFDHAYGFYNNEDYTRSTASFVLEGFQYNDNSYLLENHTIEDLYKEDTNWILLYDYGDQWEYILELLEESETEFEDLTPKIIDSKHDAPLQYPDYDEE
jgi:hypothetical protein